ncbi:MAG: AAA family ATPase [Chloroflexi bacterium]|nr:AAA family ATPase [Chloroflexota bacterium]
MLCLTSTAPPVTAQTDSSNNYWRHPASLSLDHLHPADTNNDGIDEFIIVAENGEVDLLSTDGISQWRYPANESVAAVGTTNIDGASQPHKEIIIALHNRLLLLSSTGDLLWEKPIYAVDPPQALLINSGETSSDEWRTQYPAIPVAVDAIDHDQDGHEEIVVLLQSGQVQLFDSSGQFLWRYARGTTPSLNAGATMIVDDLNQDGQEEIVLGYFRRFSQLTILDGNGRSIWEQPIGISGRITALTLVDFTNQPGKSIVVGTDRGDLNLYSANRNRIWPRTLNVPITAVSVAYLSEGPVIMVGTSAGTITGFSEEGRRIWSRQLSETADRPIIALGSVPYHPDERQPFLSVVLGSVDGSPEPSDVWLLGSNGRTLSILEAVDTTGLTRLIDINQDSNSELLLARFATVELVGMGIGSNESAREWRHSLESAPRAVLVTDLDLDGENELIVGAQNGRLHCLNNENRLCWLSAQGEPITHLADLPNISGFPSNLVVVRNSNESNTDNDLAFASRLEVRLPNSELVWEKEFQTEISTLLVEDVNERGLPEIIIGTRDGQIIVYTSGGTKLWQRQITAYPNELLTAESTIDYTRVNQIFTQENPHSGEIDLVVATPQIVYKINNNLYPRPIIYYGETIKDIYLVNQPGGELATRIGTFVMDGTMRGHHWDGIQLPQWPIKLEGNPQIILPANEIITEAFQPDAAESFLIATDAGRLARISIEDNEPVVMWQQTGLQNITSLYWGDLDGDGLPDIAAGSADDKVRLFTSVGEEPRFVDELALSSGVFALTVLGHADGQTDLVVLTENGEIELFRTQENRPPLLTNPRTETRPGQLNFTIDVIDVEGDEVVVELEIEDTANPGRWVSQGVRTTNSNESLFWPGIDINSKKMVNYRFNYDDGSYVSSVTPLPVLPPVQPSPLSTASPFLLGLLAVAAVGTAVLLIRQFQLPNAHASRFYFRLKQQPDSTLPQLENKYIATSRSQDFLLYLASQARQRDDTLISSLADGLFLLSERPHAGLSIITSALQEVKTEHPQWEEVERWHDIFQTAQGLLEAPSITELSLLRPLVVQFLSKAEKHDQWSPIFDVLLPVLTNLRDSERVEQTEDRLVYLNESLHQLHELRANLPGFSPRIEKTLVTAVMKRWFGLISSEAEELRGRAELIITLKTKRILPSDKTDVVIVIQNNGRAAAENIVTKLIADPAYDIIDQPPTISFLPPGRKRQVTFSIHPCVNDRFRIALTATFDDRNQREKTFAFGDMVHLLTRAREFNPVDNPYLPGTPLRPKSSMFFGRERLFNFIEGNVGGPERRNVLILIGQRRTGKTSALLRLEERLPAYMLPVYIDCQSLGVIPGMPAFFHDLGWLISDALSLRDIELDVPEPSEWKEDPAGQFQRHFLPKVRTLLPKETQLLLVFDEFEAFESLVDDGILPPTFFTFLRHMMQHGEGLGFVFVGTRRLEEMSADYWSVLFNIALYEHVRYLDETAALKLITEPVAPNIIYDDLAIDKILRVTAGHPYFVQLVCYTLIKRANNEKSGYITISDVNAGLDEMLSLGEVHFAYLWLRSTYVEQALLTAVAHMMDQDISFHPEDLIDYLQPYGIELEPTDVTAALTNLVEREIMREAIRGTVVQYELRIGLVGLWVAQHKSLTKLHATKPERKKHSLI